MFDGVASALLYRAAETAMHMRPRRARWQAVVPALALALVCAAVVTGEQGLAAAETAPAVGLRLEP